MVRSYDGHAGQVSSIQFRPLHAPSAPVPDIHIRAEATETAEGTSPLEVELEAELAQTMDTDGPTSDVPPTDEHDAILDSDGENEERADKDNDNDSLFGEQDESMAEARVDGSGESADASGDSDLDADGEADADASRTSHAASLGAPDASTDQVLGLAEDESMLLPAQGDEGTLEMIAATEDELRKLHLEWESRDAGSPRQRAWTEPMAPGLG